MLRMREFHGKNEEDNRIERKTANILSHDERFLYSRNCRSNPLRTPIDEV